MPGKITLVANDTDAGIKNFGNINASGSGITLASDGKLAQHGKLAAQKGSISITAGGDIYNSQQILAGTDLQRQTRRQAAQYRDYWQRNRYNNP